MGEATLEGDEERDHCADDRDTQVVRVGEGDGRALLQERVADHAAAEPGEDRQDDEPDDVESRGPGRNSSEDGVGEDAGQVDEADGVAQDDDGRVHGLPPLSHPSDAVPPPCRSGRPRFPAPGAVDPAR